MVIMYWFLGCKDEFTALPPGSKQLRGGHELANRVLQFLTREEIALDREVIQEKK